MQKKSITLIISILMVLDIPVIIYLYNFNSVVFDGTFYKKEFLKYGIYSDLEDYDIESINYDVLDYLKNEKGNNLISNNFFNEREKSHLLDVKSLIQKTFVVYHLSIILFLLLFFLLVFLLDFNFIFDFFHKTFFKVGTFTFDPEFEKIVILYPQDLFFDALAKIVANTIIMSFLIFAVSLAIFGFGFQSKFFRIFNKFFRRRN